MRKCILSVVIICVITQSCAGANEGKVEDLVTPYPLETSSEVPIGPRLPHYDEITAEDQPDHHPDNHGHIRFEEHTASPPIRFGNENNQDKTESESIRFDDRNDRILTPSYQFDETTDHKVIFDAQFPSLKTQDDANSYHDQIESGNDKASHVDDENSDENYSELADIGDEDEDIKNGDGEQSSDPKNENPDRSNVPKGIIFQEDGKGAAQEPVPKRKRKPRRKPSIQSQSEDTALNNPNAQYPPLGYPYPGGGYPGTDYQGDPNSGYPAYPPIYPTPAYPVYPTPYPTLPYPTPNYPGYTPYPGYPTPYPGYSPYPYQGPPNPRPQPTPGYPNQSQDQLTQGDTKYPSYENSGGNHHSGRPIAYPGSEYAGAGYSGYPVQPGYPGYVGYGYSGPSGQSGQYRPPYPGHQGQYGPVRTPKSLTQRAISAVAEALTSIALFDDKQCVPRLLCEVASGSAASSPTLQKATASLTPLITVLQSYNGASSSPLFLFGRAAVLGVTAKGNPTACRYEYPKCPNDPEGLVNYLNNHNGGFFRFFGKPESTNQQQNLEQFYNSLAGQYGYQQQSQNHQQLQTSNQQNVQQQQPNYGYPYGYGLQYPYMNPNYGPNYYQEQNTYRNSKDIDSEAALSNIEERIQNKPHIDAIEDDSKENGSKWTFPDEVSHKKRENKPRRERKEKSKRPKGPERPTRGDSGSLKFPDERGPINQSNFDGEREYIRHQKGIYFPNENHFNFQNYYQTTTPVDLHDYVFDYKHNFYVKRPKAVANDDSETLYIVRGNGDPNHPEIVKVRPGQSP